MVELDGQQYTISTPADNAESAIRWVNQWCIDNDVRNSKGEVASLEIAPGSPAYLIILAFAYLATICQNLLYGLGRMLNIGECSDRQLVALAENLRMRRKDPSYTTIKTLIFAQSTGPCTITPLLKASVQVGNTMVIFSPLFDITIPPLGAAVVLLQASSLGSFYIERGAITAFDEPPANILRIDSSSSLPGRPQETYASLRRRVQLRSLATSNIERCVEALRGLTGIQAASVYFNMSIYPETINNISVAPRRAIAFIQGYNEDIAKTIFSYLLCDMEPQSVSQSHTLRNGQIVTAYWDPPSFVPIKIRVFLSGVVSVEMNTQVITSVQSLALAVDIHSSLSTADVLRVINEKAPSAVVTGAELSIDGSSWKQLITAGTNELFEFIRANVEIIHNA